jgi:ParB-like chromosome segregation protein Spo0J
MDLLINSDYQIVDIDTVFQDKNNIKTHNKKDIEEKKQSLIQFGFTRPLIVEKNSKTIVAGNGVHLAASSLGYKKIPVIFMELEDAKAKALAISDNRLSENGEYDLNLFNAAVLQINQWNPDMEWKALGFDNSEIQLLLSSINSEIKSDTEPTSISSDSIDEPDVQDLPAKPLKVTKGQREIINLAIKSLRKLENDDKMQEGRCIELICADFLSNFNNSEK